MKRKISFFVLPLILCLCLTGCKSTDYREAVGMQESGDYAAAAEVFQILGDYQDSASRLKLCNEYIFAIQSFDKALIKLEEENTMLDTAIESAYAIAHSEETALDESLRPALEMTVSEAQAARIEEVERPDDLADITAATERMSGVDYSSILSALAEKQEALEYSMKQYALVNNPDEAYIIACLGKISGILEIAAATEDNDPNRQLHKEGGYTSAVYFSYEKVDQSRLYGASPIEKGTDSGGQVEVYATYEYAARRDAYLSNFDGTALGAGSHVVIGTCVIRTSNYLTATQQNELTESIIAELTKVG